MKNCIPILGKITMMEKHPKLGIFNAISRHNNKIEYKLEKIPNYIGKNKGENSIVSGHQIKENFQKNRVLSTAHT